MNEGIVDKLRAGVCTDNPGQVQQIGICPLIAVTTSFVNGLWQDMATKLLLT